MDHHLTAEDITTILSVHNIESRVIEGGYVEALELSTRGGGLWSRTWVTMPEWRNDLYRWLGY